MTTASLDFESALMTSDLMGYDTADFLRVWFGGLDADRGSVLFVRRVEKQVGGFSFKAVKGYRPDQIDEAAAFVESFEDGDSLFIKTSTFDRDKIIARMNRGEVVVGNKNEVDTVLGIAMDVDAGKRDSYASQADVWGAIHQMPVPPTMVILSGEVDHGFHVYWKLQRPITVTSPEDVELINLRVRAWRDLLCQKVAAILTGRGVTGFEVDKLVDRTYGVDRVLRPVGAERASGARVRVAAMNADRQYTLTQLTAPGWQPPAPSGPSWPRAEESIIDRYFQAMYRDGNEITIEGLLLANGYLPLGDGDWIRDDSETGSRSLSEGEIINGLPGVNVFSGGCAPLKCCDDQNDVGRRYSLYALWVAFTFGDVDLQASWSAAAQFCYDALKPAAEDVFEPVTAGPEDQTPPRIINGEKIGNTVIPKSMIEIAAQTRAAFGEWPKACQGDLFVLGRDGRSRLLDNPSKLFGWLNTGAQTVFHSGPGVVSKSEFFEQLPQFVDQCRAIEVYPHFPPIEDHYYLSLPPDAGSGKTLERFLDFFSPATVQDRQLILALIVTTFWGGPPGSRPMFAVDATNGTGTGKSALAFKIASLSGSCFQFDQTTNEDRIRSHLASDPAGDKRMVLIDNAKTTRLSSATMEAMITAPEIGGHAMYRGFRSRPNHLTWVVTMNGLAMSRDLAHRTVKIIVTPPQQRKQWNEAVDRFITVNRDYLIADIAAFFERPTRDLESYGRWSGWENAILSRLDDPDELKRLIKERAAASDEDESTSDALIEYFGQRLTDLKYDIENDVVHIPLQVCAEWTAEATGREQKRRGTDAMLTMLKESGSLKGLVPNPCRAYGRGWLWTHTDKGRLRRDSVLYDVLDRIGAEGFN